MSNRDIATTQGHSQSPEVAVVMVPLPAQGHLNQLLHLSRLLSSRPGLSVHYACSATHNRQAKTRVHGWDPLSPTTTTGSTFNSIHFHDLPLPATTDLPDLTISPNPNTPLKFPYHLLPLFKSTPLLCGPLAALLRSLSAAFRRVVVVHDSIMSFAAHEASLLPNVEAYCFYACSAFCIFYPNYDISVQNIGDDMIPKELLGLVSIEDCLPEEFWEFIYADSEFTKLCSGYLYNTCEAIDGRFLQRFRELDQFKSTADRHWGIGPLNPIISLTDSTTKSKSINRHKCLDWLDQQPMDSVLYISFGTMTPVSDEQITELANGLEQSEQRFIWVVRDADKGDIYAERDHQKRQMEVSKGFEERVRERGVVVRDWAPQLEILAHASTGGFVSHCGWNSCVESLSMGVPIAAWPMHSDQPNNAILVTGVLRVGLVAREWKDRERVVSAESVASVVRRLMVCDEGRVLRARARELGPAVRAAVAGGGSSTQELDAFVSHICRSGEEVTKLN